MTWIIAILAIALSFFIKYAKRNNKERSWSLTFWAKDNYPELIASVLAMIILMVIFQRTVFDSTALTEKLPWITSLPMDLIAAALAGYLNNELWYAIVKKAKGK